MARRNLFQPPPPPAAATPEAEPRRAFPNTGAMSGMRSTLRDMSSNAVREIDPSLIEDGGPKDRLAFSDADVAVLAESISAHGQQVPIMVRPIAESPGRYRIIYGRRRLRALRLLGIPAKALVRSLDDQQAILAQGQENSQRLDPSFIEKALFAAELAEAQYDGAVIQDALAVDKPMLSRMSKVARSIPAEVIQLIGPAHGIGRRRWEELADAARDGDIDLAALGHSLAEVLAPLASDERFAVLARAALQRPAVASAAASQVVTLADGSKLAELRSTPRALTIKVSSSDAPGFTQWLAANAEPELLKLYQSWQAKDQSV